MLTTTFCLVEQCLNSRPITHVSPEATDFDALTPNHFLLRSASSTLPSHFRTEIEHRKRYVPAQVYSKRNLESLAQGVRSKPQLPLEMVQVARTRPKNRRTESTQRILPTWSRGEVELRHRCHRSFSCSQNLDRKNCSPSCQGRSRSPIPE